MNLSFEDIREDEMYEKGFKAGQKLSGHLISIETNLYLLTAYQYGKFSKMDKENNLSESLEWVETFGKFIKKIEPYNY